MSQSLYSLGSSLLYPLYKGWMGPKASLNLLVKKGQFLSSAENRNIFPLSTRNQLKSLYRLSLLVSLLVLGTDLLYYSTTVHL